MRNGFRNDTIDEYGSKEGDDGYRSPELRAEIARGKLPVSYDPNKNAYDRLNVMYIGKQGPFSIGRFRPGVGGGIRGDFMLRLTCLKRGMAQGEIDVRNAMSQVGLDETDVDRAISHGRAEHLDKRVIPTTTNRTSSTVTIREL